VSRRDPGTKGQRGSPKEGSDVSEGGEKSWKVTGATPILQSTGRGRHTVRTGGCVGRKSQQIKTRPGFKRTRKGGLLTKGEKGRYKGKGGRILLEKKKNGKAINFW